VANLISHVISRNVR